MTTRLTIDRIEVEHARFNAIKTVATSTPSQFQTKTFGSLTATRDAMRVDGYYNRVLGLSTRTLDRFDEALAWVATANENHARVDVAHGHECEAELRRRGFRHDNTLVWLRSLKDSTAARPAAEADGACRLLTTLDWPALRLMLEQHGPIDDAVWLDKRNFLCTDTFRWFGIFEAEQLVSAASLWETDDLAILGSAFTLHLHRGRGHQQTLLAARRAASPLPLYVDVEPNSISHRNCQRGGFHDVEYREVWIV